MANIRRSIPTHARFYFGIASKISFGLIILPSYILPPFNFLSFSSLYPNLSSPIELAQMTGQQSDREDSIIDGILQTFRQRRSRGEGIRRGEFCAISPGLIETDRVWSDRPLFLWQGAVKQVNLRQLGNSQILWSQLITPDSQSSFQHVNYTGATLQPGEIYQWELVNESNRRTTFIFQVMKAEERDAFTTQLQSLETQLQQQGASSQTIALRQAQIFADKGLWSDVLQMLSAIDPPLPKATEAVQRLATDVCSSLPAPTSPETPMR